MNSRCLSAIVSLISFSAAVHAEILVRGVVKELPSLETLDGVRVSLKLGPGGAIVARGTSNDDGVFQFSVDREGSYVVEVEKDGYFDLRGKLPGSRLILLTRE